MTAASTRARAWDFRWFNASSCVMAAASGPTPRWTKARPFSSRCRTSGKIPLPILHLRQVFAVLRDIVFVLDELLPELLLEIDTLRAGLRQAVDGVHHEMKAVEIV